MSEQGALFQLLLAGLQAGLCLALSLALATSRLALAARVCATLAVLAFFINILGNTAFQELFGDRGSVTREVLLTAGMTAGALAWAAAFVLFEDRPVRPWLFAPAAVMILAEVLMETADGAARRAIWQASNLFSLALVLHVLFIVGRGHAGDLVESRRRIRRPLVLGCILFGAAMVAVQAFTLPGWIGRDAWPFHAAKLIQFVGVLVIVAALIQLRRQLFEAPTVRTSTENDVEIARLHQLMAKGEPWRREGLGIASLSAELGVPEHRLRRLINSRLGHRNFRAFVNSYRIEAAKRRLADGRDGGTVAEIAFDLGYSSLSTFNRVFKEIVGVTPTEWRREPHDQN